MGVAPGPAGEDPPPPPHRTKRPQQRTKRPLPEPMSKRNVAILAGFVGVLYAVGMIGRGAVAPGIVGGILAAILLFLVMREIGERQRRRIRDRDRSRSRSS